jgi:hypothetical protein
MIMLRWQSLARVTAHRSVKRGLRMPPMNVRLTGTSIPDAIAKSKRLIEAPSKSNGVHGAGTEGPLSAPEKERDGRDGRDFSGYPGLIEETMTFLASYIVLPEPSLLVMATWVVAAWLMEVWDRFPHLAVTSPEKRCGKSTLLDVLKTIVPKPRYTTNISPAALYRIVEGEKPTLLMDEAQSLSRRGSEASEVVREILLAGIGKNAKVIRCGGDRYEEIQEFGVYSPKVFAMVGNPDGVLADRCLPVLMKRRTKADKVRRFRSRVVEEEGKLLHDKLALWAIDHAEQVRVVYDTIEPFDIDNDRMAELLTPLQATLRVMEELAHPVEREGSKGSEGFSRVLGRSLETLLKYARGVEEHERELDSQSTGVKLLAACREIFATGKLDQMRKGPWKYLSADSLIQCLVARKDESWATCRPGERPITREALAVLLRPYGIRSEWNEGRTGKVYYAARFREAWERYLPPPPENPSNPSDPFNPSRKGGGGE